MNLYFTVDVCFNSGIRLGNFCLFVTTTFSEDLYSVFKCPLFFKCFHFGFRFNFRTLKLKNFSVFTHNGGDPKLDVLESVTTNCTLGLNSRQVFIFALDL